MATITPMATMVPIAPVVSLAPMASLHGDVSSKFHRRHYTLKSMKPLESLVPLATLTPIVLNYYKLVNEFVDFILLKSSIKCLISKEKVITR